MSDNIDENDFMKKIAKKFGNNLDVIDKRRSSIRNISKINDQTETKDNNEETKDNEEQKEAKDNEEEIENVENNDFMKELTKKFSNSNFSANKRRLSIRKSIQEENDDEILLNNGIIDEEYIKDLEKSIKLHKQFSNEKDVNMGKYEEINRDVMINDEDLKESRTKIIELTNELLKKNRIIEAAKKYFRIVKNNRDDWMNTAKKLKYDRDAFLNMYDVLNKIFQNDNKIIENGMNGNFEGDDAD